MSSTGTSLRIGRELREICGAGLVIEDPAELQSKQIGGVVPGAAVIPASPGEVAAILRLANEHRLSVVPSGGRTRQRAGKIPDPIDLLLETSSPARSRALRSRRSDHRSRRRLDRRAVVRQSFGRRFAFRRKLRASSAGNHRRIAGDGARRSVASRLRRPARLLYRHPLHRPATAAKARAAGVW